MANNHVAYDRSTPFGQMTAEAVTAIREAQAKVNRIQEVLIQMGALGGGTNGAVLEGGNPLFGVPAGKGNAYVTAIGYLKDGLNGTVALAQDQVANVDLGG